MDIIYKDCLAHFIVNSGSLY